VLLFGAGDELGAQALVEAPAAVLDGVGWLERQTREGMGDDSLMEGAIARRSQSTSR
jgi:hypothetical protein